MGGYLRMCGRGCKCVQDGWIIDLFFLSFSRLLFSSTATGSTGQGILYELRQRTGRPQNIRPASVFSGRADLNGPYGQQFIISTSLDQLLDTWHSSRVSQMLND